MNAMFVLCLRSICQRYQVMSSASAKHVGVELGDLNENNCETRLSNTVSSGDFVYVLVKSAIEEINCFGYKNKELRISRNKR